MRFISLYLSSDGCDCVKFMALGVSLKAHFDVGLEFCATTLLSSVKKCNVYVDEHYAWFGSYPALCVTLNSVIFKSYVACVCGKG